MAARRYNSGPLQMLAATCALLLCASSVLWLDGPRELLGQDAAIDGDESSGAEADSGQASADPRRAGVEAFVQRYFRSWSDKDMKVYASCFAEGAVVQFIEPKGGIRTFELKRFLAEQREVHRQTANQMSEVPLNMEIRFDARLAHALVYWRLDIGSQLKTYGYDHFTLVRTKDDWRIVNLVYYEVDRAR